MNAFLGSSLLICLFISCVNCQIVANNNDLHTLTRNYLPSQFTNSSFTLDDAKKLLHKKCRKVAIMTKSPPLKYEIIDRAANKLLDCANGIANINVLMAEIEAARPLGGLDVVFHKYCEKLPQAEQCLMEFNEQLLPCLTPTERAQNAIMMRIVTSLLGFICHKNGDQIALFIAEEGPECLEANKENISNCMNATFSGYWPQGVVEDGQMSSPLELPELVMGPKQCIDLHNFEECVLTYMEKCNEITPSNIIESLFRHVKNETKCQQKIDNVISFHPIQQQEVTETASHAVAINLAIYLVAFMVGLSVFSKYCF